MDILILFNSRLQDFTEYQFKQNDFGISGGASIIGDWTAPNSGYVEGILKLCTYYSGTHEVKSQLQDGSKIIQCTPTTISSQSPEVSEKHLAFSGYVTKGRTYAIVINDNNGGGSGLSTSRLIYRYL